MQEVIPVKKNNSHQDLLDKYNLPEDFPVITKQDLTDAELNQYLKEKRAMIEFKIENNQYSQKKSLDEHMRQDIYIVITEKYLVVL